MARKRPNAAERARRRWEKIADGTVGGSHGDRPTYDENPTGWLVFLVIVAVFVVVAALVLISGK